MPETISYHETYCCGLERLSCSGRRTTKSLASIGQLIATRILAKSKFDGDIKTVTTTTQGKDEELEALLVTYGFKKEDTWKVGDKVFNNWSHLK